MSADRSNHLRTIVLLALACGIMALRAMDSHLGPGIAGTIGAAAFVVTGLVPLLERSVRALRKKPTTARPTGGPYRDAPPPAPVVVGNRWASWGVDVLCLVLALAAWAELRSPEPVRGYRTPEEPYHPG